MKSSFDATFNQDNFDSKFKKTAMETKIIKGEIIKDKIFYEVKQEIARIEATYKTAPGIAFVEFSCTPLAKYNIPLHFQGHGVPCIYGDSSQPCQRTGGVRSD